MMIMLLRFVLGIDEDHVVGNNTGGDPLGAILISNLSVVDPTLNHRSLSLPQVLHNGIPKIWLEHHDPMPIGALGPVSRLEPTMSMRLILHPAKIILQLTCNWNEWPMRM